MKLAIFLLLASCGAQPPAVTDEAAALFPLEVGRSWSYRVTNTDGDVQEKHQEVIGVSELDGIGKVFVLETSRDDGERVRSFQANTGHSVERYREETYAGEVLTGIEAYIPYKLRLPTDLDQVGDTRSVSYSESIFDSSGILLSKVDKVEDWEVEAIETVTVPAGSFDDALRLVRTSRTSESEKRFWFVRGIGKVKEVAGGQSEELTEHLEP